MDQHSRMNNFDQVRLFGAILVIYGHAYALTGVPVPGFAVNAVSTIGVKIFFSISGYLVALSWLNDPNVARFMMRRLLRLMPALVVVVLLSAFVMGPILTKLSLVEYFRNPQPYFYLKNIALYINYYLPGVFEDNVYPGAVNGSLWSLPAEFVMYLLTPVLIGVATLLAGRAAFAVIGVIFIVTAYWFTSIGPHFRLVIYANDVWSWLSLAPYFVMGMLYAVCRLDRFFNIYIGAAGLFVLAIFETNVPIKEAMLLLILPYFTLSFGTGFAPALRKVTRGADLSYGLFLYGFPIEQILRLKFAAVMGPWKTFVLATVISAGFAYMSWHWIEKPALGWKPRSKKREHEVGINPQTAGLPLDAPSVNR